MGSTGINGDQRGAAQEQRDLLVPELCGGDTERFSMPVIPVMEDHEMPFIWGPKKSKHEIYDDIISGWWFGT
jgi:hypothetical protein